ncbi:unnamed protein product [Onchocerca ochengi]|uniref:Intraflagellar transport protein 46 homolog n=2 Tax=Onchocerca TaxID=6281 RepID=A0A182E6E4_ONCOC|nr:unnamed protein product [Onchocerca ochengi]
MKCSKRKEFVNGNRVNRETQDYQFDDRIRLPTERAIVQIRKKQEAIEDDSDNVDNIGTEEDNESIDQLDDLELAILARIVQNQLDRYDPDLSVEEYQIVKLPHRSVRQPVLPYTEDIGDNKNDLTIFTDDQPRIVLPIIEWPEDGIYETNEQIEEIPKYVLMPTEEMITIPANIIEDDLAPIDEDALNDLELRSRIALLAHALNERATRGL